MKALNWKLWSTFGTAVTILVLASACSSKQVINESNLPMPIEDEQEYTDSASDANPYIDRAEEPVRETKKLKKNKKSKKKSALLGKRKKKMIAKHQPAAPAIEESKFDESALAAAAGTVGGPDQMPPPPPIMEEEAVLEDTSLSFDYFGWFFSNWYFFAALAGILGFAWLGTQFVYKKSKKSKSKRKLVFN